jgi:hypothetical protein
MDPEFTIKATAHNIHPYPFPGHLTHVLQPLDVGVFQPYKHWHKKAVQHAMRNLDLDYNVASFMRDMQEIRAETFKKGTIHSAFRKAGIWPISCKTALQKMKTYAPPENLEPDLPTIPQTPTRFQHAEYGLLHWKNKIADKLSSPSREPFESWARGTEKILASGELTVLQHNALATRVQNQQKAKYRNRNVLQKNGVLTAEEAWAKKEANAAKRKAILEKKKATLIRITRNKIKNDLKARGVLARRSERERKKAVEALEKAGNFIPPDMLEAIPDPERTTTEADIEVQLQEALVSTIAAIDPSLDDLFCATEAMEATEDTLALQADYIPLDDTGNMELDYLDADDDADIGLF